MSLFLEMNYALGARRGEVLALRWRDIVDGYATIAWSLSQSKEEGLVFKPVKGHEDTEEQRVVKVPEETLAKLEGHRKRQDEFRKQHGQTTPSKERRTWRAIGWCKVRRRI
jgi:integrase